MTEWDERYGSDDFVYGTEPNTFLVEHADRLVGPVLSLAEGEGRNAVYLASLGFDVLGVDQSRVGLAKAHRLASLRGVTIRTEVVDLATYSPPEEAFGSVVSIFGHLPSAVRRTLYQRVERSLRPGGLVLFEAYTKAQLGRGTGGPPNPDWLPSRAEVESEFAHCEPLLSREIERDVVEGKFHSGLGAVVQFLGRKRA